MPTTAADAGVAHRVYRLRADTFYVRRTDGVWLRNDAGAFSVRGDRAYQLVDAIAKELDGIRTVEQICAGLSDSARAAVLTLVTRLDAHGFLKDVTASAEPGPPQRTAPDLAARYGDVLNYLDHYLDAPVRAFTAARQQPVTCLGSGTTGWVLAVALAELGLADVRLAGPDPRMAELVTAAAQRDPALRWRLLPGHRSRAELARTGGVLLLATDGAWVDEIDVLASIGHRAGARVGVLAPLGDRVVATPVTTQDAPVSFADLRSRAPDPHPPARDAGLPATPVAMLAHQLAMRVLAALVGPPLPEDTTTTSVASGTLTVLTHRPRPLVRAGAHRPLATAPPVGPVPAAPIRPDVPSSFDSAGMVAAQDAIVATTASWTDPVFGPLLDVGEADLPQLPLAASRCELRLPGRRAGLPVRCFGLSARECRNQSVLAALEVLAGAVLDAGEPGWRSGWQLAAGWSGAEALTRAALARHRGRAEALTEWSDVALRVSGTGAADSADTESPADRRRFLIEALADTGGVPAVQVGACDGLVLARVTGTGVPAAAAEGVAGRVVAAGLSGEHAVDQALLELLVHRVGAGATAPDGTVPDGSVDPVVPDRTGAGAVLLHPGNAVTDWTPATVDGARDLGGLLPFLDGRAALVAVPR